MKQRRALVTGASGAIGAAIASELAHSGHRLILHAHRGTDRVRALAETIAAGGGSAEIAQFDVADAAASAPAMEALLASEPIDIVVHNAGIHDDAPMAGLSDEQWHSVIDVSLNGFFHVVRPCLLPMARQRFGRVIGIGSVAGRLGNRGQTNYAAAKAAMVGAVKSLAREMASRGITANVVAPGIIGGGMAHFADDEIRRLVPAARAGTPAEVAALVRFLCTDTAGYINGQEIGINGGMG